MSDKECRVTPRKRSPIPIRFRTFASEFVPAAADVAPNRLSTKLRSVRMATAESETLEGETVNLSEGEFHSSRHPASAWVNP